jgi:hypothetical protein
MSTAGRRHHRFSYFAAVTRPSSLDALAALGPPHIARAATGLLCSTCAATEALPHWSSCPLLRRRRVPILQPLPLLLASATAYGHLCYIGCAGCAGCAWSSFDSTCVLLSYPTHFIAFFKNTPHKNHGSSILIHRKYNYSIHVSSAIKNLSAILGSLGTPVRAVQLTRQF